MELKMNSHQVNHSNTTEMDQYSEYLMSSYPNQFMPMIKFSEQYETFLVYYQKKGYKLDELFLKCIRDNNMLMFRRMIMDPRVNLSYQNNEALIICIFENKYIMLSMLLSHPSVFASDQNNLALRIAISKKDKTSLNLLLKNKNVLDNIYQDPELLSYVWIYQNNGNIIL
jgi:hypothetical protein